MNIETYSVKSKEHRPVISWITLLCMVTYKGAYGYRQDATKPDFINFGIYVLLLITFGEVQAPATAT